jgi:hypothetical protein
MTGVPSSRSFERDTLTGQRSVGEIRVVFLYSRWPLLPASDVSLLHCEHYQKAKN